MDFILGTLGFLQITCIPGLIGYKLFRFRADLFDKVLTVFGISLIANYCIVFLLVILGIYTRISLGLFILGEFIALIWLYRNDLRTPVKSFLDAGQDGINKIIRFFFPEREKDNVSVLNYFLGIILLALSATSILWAVNIFIKNLGTVFSSWDAVVSWNHWATMWAVGKIPTVSHLYPHLIPINWSITYVLLGSTTIQFFAKGLMPLFTLMILLGLFNLSIQTRKYYFLVSLILLQPLLEKFIKNGIYNGYVDIAVAFFAFAAIYFLIKAQEIAEVEQRNPLYILGAIFCAGAAVTKQTGVYIALCYPILVGVTLVISKSQVDKKYLRMLISWFAVISLIWVSWYLLKEVQFLTGRGRANIDTLIAISANTYNNVGVLQQIAAAIGRQKELIALFILIVVVFPWINRFYKTLTLLFAPYPLLWGWMAAYDTRNLAIFLPVLALISGHCITTLLLKLIDLLEKTRGLQTRIYIPLAVACLGLVALNFIATPQRLLQRQESLQKQIFSPNKNQMLYDLVEENGPQTRILTNYPMNYLPGLGKYQVRTDFDDYNVFLANVQNPEIEYILLPNAIDAQVKDYVNAKIAAGDYQVLAKDKQWKMFTLIQILKRER